MQQELFDLSEVEDLAYRNPMVVMYGKGPIGQKCKTCVQLTEIRTGQNVYKKCKLPGITHGPGTDHLVGYHACKFYEAREAG